MVVAIEWLTAARALDIRGDSFISPLLDAARAAFRVDCPSWEGDCILSVPMADADAFLAGADWPTILTAQEVLA